VYKHTAYLNRKGQKKKHCTNNLSGYLLSIHFSTCIHNVSQSVTMTMRRTKGGKKTMNNRRKCLSNRSLHAHKNALLV